MRPSTMAVLAAYQVLHPDDAKPPLEIEERNYELVRAALQAADRVDPPISQEFQERLRILRAVAIYRGAIALRAAEVVATGGARSQPVQLVLEAMAILTAAESHLGTAPYPEGGNADQLVAL